jgi:hypothetical protein
VQSAPTNASAARACTTRRTPAARSRCATAGARRAAPRRPSRSALLYSHAMPTRMQRCCTARRASSGRPTVPHQKAARPLRRSHARCSTDSWWVLPRRVLRLPRRRVATCARALWQPLGTVAQHVAPLCRNVGDGIFRSPGLVRRRTGRTWAESESDRCVLVQPDHYGGKGRSGGAMRAALCTHLAPGACTDAHMRYPLTCLFRLTPLPT